MGSFCPIRDQSISAEACPERDHYHISFRQAHSQGHFVGSMLWSIVVRSTQTFLYVICPVLDR
jgi:hypothetical protein